MENDIIKYKKADVIERCVKTIAFFGGIQVKHSVNLLNKDFKGNIKGLSGDTYKSRKEFMNGKAMTNYILKTHDLILLESKRKTAFNDETNSYTPVNPNIFYLSYGDISVFTQAIDEVKKWLMGDEFNDLYLFDENNNPVGVNLKYNNTVYVINSSISPTKKRLTFEPAIVTDGTVNYTGVRFLSETGEIGSMSGSEFISFSSIILNNLTNLYGNSIALVNLVLSYDNGEKLNNHE